jgi:hypothetical protein
MKSDQIQSAAQGTVPLLMDKPYRDDRSMSLEPFVSAEEAANFLAIKRRYLLALARKGIAGAYSLGTGMRRKTWVFRLSELASSVAGKKPQ